MPSCHFLHVFENCEVKHECNEQVKYSKVIEENMILTRVYSVYLK